MKTTNLTAKILMGILCVGVLLYFAIYLFQSYTGGLTTVFAYSDTVNVGLEASGSLVREETVISAANPGTVDLSPSEGEKVAAGNIVATLYNSSSGLEVKQAIQLLEAELEQLQYAQRSAAVIDADRLEDDILSSIAGLHASAASGDLTDLERDALELRTLIFKREYSYGDANASAEVEAAIAAKSAELASLRASLGSASTVITTSRSGTFSGLVDGFESQLTPGMLSELTPSKLNSLRRQQPMVDNSAIGKIITSSTWYFAAAVNQEKAQDLRRGQKYDLVFSHDYSGQITMKLDSISDPENGQVVLVFSCNTDLANTTMLRHQTVDIVTQQVTGIRVPRSALRVLTETQTDKKTGKETEVQITGVYTAVSAQSEFKPVNVLYQGEDYYLVEPANPNAADRLRVGDEVIISTAGLKDGTVIRR